MQLRYWYSRNLEKPKIEYDYLWEALTLEEYLKDEKLSYYNRFDKVDCSIEVAQSLPIIDIMLTSIKQLILIITLYNI